VLATSSVVLALIAGVIVGGSPAAARSSRGTAARRPNRLLVFSIPGVTWSDVDARSAPVLTRLLEESATADLVTRADRQPASLGAAYVTIGSGTRSASASTDGDAVGTSEPFADTTGATAYHQRTGRDPGRGIVQLGIAQITGANAALLFDARVGALGDRLRGAGYSRAVIANADQPQPTNPDLGTTVFERPAVSALMGADGILREGAVGRELLAPDAYAPYGVHLDANAVTRAFRRAWRPHAVVLVEGSDLERANRFGSLATSHHATELRKLALRSTDVLLGRLLAGVDPTRDAVMVVAPTSRSGDRSLTVAALRAPGVDTGLLQSATTRRAGFVTLTDIAPTILVTLGVAPPASMEGRPMRVAVHGGSLAARRSLLIRANDDGLLRDRLVEPVTKFVGWFAVILALTTALLVGRRAWVGALLRLGALWIVGFVLATFLVAPLHAAQHGGETAFWVFTLLVASAFAGVCRVARARHPVDPLIVASSAVVIVLVIDNLTHDHLEFNAVFGYSPTVGIRLSGNGNAAFSILGASAVLLAGLIAWRTAHRRAAGVAIAVLAVVLIAFTPPYFGQDFGGTVAAAPAFLVMAWLLLGRPIRLRTCLAFVGALLVSGLIVGFVDLLRPHDQRTHVGRFFEQVNRDGWSGLTTVLQRKASENAATLAQSLSLLVIAAAIATVVVLWLRAPSPLRRLGAAIPTLRATAIGFGLLAVLGYALNDSGTAIPALMCVVAVAGLAFLTSIVDRIDPEDAGADHAAGRAVGVS
jgi:hypothetical protein